MSRPTEVHQRSLARIAYYLQDEARSNSTSSYFALGGRSNPALPNLAS